MLTLFRFLLVSFLCGKIDGFISSDKRVHQKPKIPVASMSSKEYAPTKSKKRKRSLSKIDDCSIPNASLKNVKEEDMMITDEECFEPLQIPCEINGHVIPAIIDTGESSHVSFFIFSYTDCPVLSPHNFLCCKCSPLL